MALTQLEPYMVNTSGSFTVGSLTATTSVVAAGTTVQPIKIATVQSATSGYISDAGTAVNTLGGYLIITGSGFQSGCQVLIGTTYAASTSFVDSTRLNVQVNTTSSGTYPVYVINTDGSVGVKVPGVTFDAYPVWSTGTTLPPQVVNAAISIQLAATDTNTVTYSVSIGSTLPAGLNLSSSGLLSGTVTSISNQTVYTFSIDAIDSFYNEKTARTFSVTVAVGDPFFKYTTILLSGDGTNNAQNNAFVDSSTNNFAITRSANTTQGTFSPYGSNWSNYLDGTSGQYLNTVANAAFSLGTGDFTIEAWIYPTGTNPSLPMPIVEIRTSASNTSGFAFMRKANSLTLDVYQNGYLGASTGSLTLNYWNHVALVRNGNTWTYWINGNSAGSFSNNTNLTDGATTGPKIGGSTSAGEVWIGYISNFRIVKGTAVYTSAFTPSTSFLTPMSGTVLLTCQSNRFVDNSTNAFAITVNGSPTVERFSPFSPNSSYAISTVGGSAYFDGNGDYLSLASNTAFDMGTGNFTLECYYYHVSGSSATYPSIFSSTDWVTGGVGLRFNNLSSSKFQFFWNGVGDPWLSASATSNPFQWNHVALTRSGNNFTLWVNGQSAATGTASGAINFNYNTGGPRIGWGPWDGANGYLKGIISNFRLVKGTAVYTTAFTPPTAPVTNITGTSLLCDFTNAGIIDGAMMNNIETVGDAKISNVQTRYGSGSMYFDGNGDYLNLPNNINTNLSKVYTVECWIYVTSLATDVVVWFNGTFGSDDNRIQLTVRTTGRIDVYSVNTGAQNYYPQSSTGLISTNTWYHTAVVSDGTTVSLYVNGTSVASSAITGTPPTVNNLYIGYGRAATTNMFYPGYIDDFRITRGYARYTSNFNTSLPTQLIGQ